MKLILPLLSLLGVYAFPAGSPICDVVPNVVGMAGRTNIQTGGGWVIRASAPSYTPGQPLQISIQREVPSAPLLRGVLIYAEDSQGTRFGSFTANPHLKLMAVPPCNNPTTATQTHPLDAASVSATWTAPASDVGPLTFRALAYDSTRTFARPILTLSPSVASPKGCCYDVGFGAMMVPCCHTNFRDVEATQCTPANRMGGATQFSTLTCAAFRSSLPAPIPLPTPTPINPAPATANPATPANPVTPANPATPAFGCCYDVGFGAQMKPCCHANFRDVASTQCGTVTRMGGATQFSPLACAAFRASLIPAVDTHPAGKGAEDGKGHAEEPHAAGKGTAGDAPAGKGPAATTGKGPATAAGKGPATAAGKGASAGPSAGASAGPSAGKGTPAAGTGKGGKGPGKGGKGTGKGGKGPASEDTDDTQQAEAQPGKGKGDATSGKGTSGKGTPTPGQGAPPYPAAGRGTAAGSADSARKGSTPNPVPTGKAGNWASATAGKGATNGGD